MKLTRLALAVAATLVLAGCHSDSSAPIEKDIPLIKSDLYLRGLNGDWGTAQHAKLHYQGGDNYETVLRVARGSNEFKIADEGWKIQFTNYVEPINFDASEPFYPKPEDNTDCMNLDCNSEITFKEKGYYKFNVNFSDTSNATMRVTTASQEEAQKYYQDALTDPSVVHKGHQQKITQQFENFDDSKDTVTFSVKDINAQYREFGISTTTELRDALDQGVYVNEIKGNPRVVTGDLAFDALFALSLQELGQLAVDEIRDGNYNHNKPIDAKVFETGAKWHYVWTRDLSYAADLSVALLNPERVKNGLTFKLSGFRDETDRKYDGEQIIQDTGTGGSWPISTDRTTWALGAERLLSTLSGQEYEQFAERAYNALKNTIMADREAVFDETSNLYTGEQSFLDWREQTYSSWSHDDVNVIGTSKSLSTNITHYRSLVLAAKLAGQYDSSQTVQFTQWANTLKQAINDQFWDTEKGLYVSYIFDNKGGIKVDKYDMLGEALAITSGIASDEQATKIMANYPHSQFGVPVYFPQQPGVPVYHNRAIWPFVTAYSLRAANQTKNIPAANNAYQSLLRGTATNLSNMENLEWLSGHAFILHSDYDKDASLDGPVINSQRQLWSVAGYLNMVIEQLFGLKTDNNALTVEPFITSWMRNTVFKNSQKIVLDNFRYKNEKYRITVQLPPVDNDMEGYLDIASIVQDDTDIVVTLGSKIAGSNGFTEVKNVKPFDISNDTVFSPEEAVLSVVQQGNSVQIDVTNRERNTLNLYRNNTLIKEDVAGNQFNDTVSQDAFTCYTAETINSAGHRSNPSRPVCVGSTQQIKFTGEYQPLTDNISTVTLSGINGTLQGATTFSVAETGKYDFSTYYTNNQGQLNTGITNAVKVLTVIDSHGEKVASGVIQMGHVGEKNGMRFSTPMTVNLNKGEQYQFELSDYFNMSYLSSNKTYIYSGGIDGIVNSAELAYMQISRH